MGKIFGIDLGTNSIGLSDRDITKGKNLKDQLDYYSSVIFKSAGISNGKTGEFSYAAEERTKHRSTRRLYQARKYRIWETLKVLIDFGFCPLSKTALERWSKYEKSKGLKRQYPIDAVNFEQWVRLDFNGDGKADYTSPYQLRAELMEIQFDFENEIDRFKLGRALYHIAQRRGFKSSKGETIKEQETAETDSDIDTESDVLVELKKSEEKKSKDLVEYMKKYNFPTIGCAFAHLEKLGVRVRNSEYQAVRSQYKEEIQKIFEFQKGLDVNSEFYKRIISEKKGEGSIFYKRPLRSQKGLVGKCTLEPNKSRCPISHPEFEKFRAWCFINNIKYKTVALNKKNDWKTLTKEQKEKLFQDKFLRTTPSFKFEDIRKWMEKKLGIALVYKEKTINFKDNTNVYGCPISGRLKKLLGEDWENIVIQSNKERTNKKTGEIHKITYNAESLWHICFSFDEAEYVEEFAKSELAYDDKKAKELVRLWGVIPQGYGMLSLKAIKAINVFLQKGLIYSDATLLAKLPEIFDKEWAQNEDKIINEIGVLVEQNRNEKRILNIANNLIANYKSLGYDEETRCNERFADHNTEYKLDDSDFRDVEKISKESFGNDTWLEMPDDRKKRILQDVAILYQQFFASSKRDYFILPKLGDTLKKYLSDNYDFLHCPNNFRDNDNPENPCHCEACKKLNKLYHPSMIELYAPAKEEFIDNRYIKLLGSPVIGALKNPMAMRVLHILRKQINALLLDNVVNEDTRIVVEMARDLNDANMRWAIETFQREREKENKEFEIAITELIKDTKFSGIANPNSNDDIDKLRIWVEQSNNEMVSKLNSKGKPLATNEQGWKTYGYTTSKLMFDVLKCKTDAVKKYRLWKEQNFQCIYTGQLISIEGLFTPNKIDIEHTIPRSISFDNSLANLTVCDAHYNRTIKKNQIPAQLTNYDEILQRIQPWIEKVEQLKDNVEFWKGQSKRAQNKDRKDKCIRQQHLWQMELDYWYDKVSRFTMKEVTSGFRHSQLNDTRIITKYAYHYLKTVFTNVEVQKGSVTADFRKMLGVQSIEEKKSRDKHSHHAIDATILTLIPSAAKRDRMLQLFYKIQEEKKLGNDTSKLEHDLEKEKKSCGIGSISDIGQFIEENILVNHISKDQTLTPANKRLRVRGKIVPKRNENGEIIYEKDANGEFKLYINGNKIPEAKYRIKGDCIRGQLHKDSFFGAIKYPATDNEGNPQKQDGHYVYTTDKDGSEIISMVARVPLNGFKDEKEIAKIIDPNVRRSVKTAITKRKDEGKTFATAIAEPIWMLDSSGNERKVDKKGRTLLPIRHVRCKVVAGRGFFTKEKAIEVKKQTYLSTKRLLNVKDREYKQWYYAQNDENYLCLLYERKDKGIIERKFRLLNYFDIVRLNQEKRGSELPLLRMAEDLWKEPFYQKIEEKKKIYNLTAIIKAGTRVLMWNKTPDELCDLPKVELHKRLFVVYKFNLKGVNCVYLHNHIEARKDVDIKDEFTTFDATKYQARLVIVANNFNCMLEGKDFEISNNGKIKFL